MEHRREWGDPERTGRTYLTHYVHLNCADVTERDVYLGLVIAESGIFSCENAFYIFIGLVDSHAVEIYRAELCDHDTSLRGNHLGYMLLIVTPHVDHHFVARAELVVLRGRHVLIGLESQAFGIEKFTAIYRSRTSFTDVFRIYCRRIIRQTRNVASFDNGYFLDIACTGHKLSTIVLLNGRLRRHISAALALVLGLDTFHLFGSHSFGHQFFADLFF